MLDDDVLRPNGVSAGMDETERLSAVLGLIYDAALDPGVWTEAIHAACVYVGCWAGALGSFDFRRTDTSLEYNWGYLPGYPERLKNYWEGEPMVAHSFRMKVGEVATMGDLVPLDEFKRTRMFREWAEPQGLIESLQLVVERSPLAMAVVGMARHHSQGTVDDGVRRRLRLLGPHFRRSVLIGKAVDLARFEAAALADTMDGLKAGVFLVDEAGAVIHTNRAGRELLAEGVLSDAGGALTARDHKADRQIHDAFAASARGDTASPPSVSVQFAEPGGEGHVGHVLPLGAGRRRAIGGDRVVAALFVRRPGVALPEPAASVAAHYGLTPSEGRVLLLVLQTGSVPAAAAMLGLAEPTVKTHLRHIFDKTGTSSQIELTRLVTSHASLLRAV